MKEKIIKECIDTYKKFLPNVNMDDLDEAINYVYEDGMTAEYLTKKTYSFLYPVRDPKLWDETITDD